MEVKKTMMKQYLEKKQRGTENFPFAYYKEKYSNHMIHLHWHQEIELLYGISGELAVTVAEEKYILRQGDILFINPEEVHSYSPYSEEVQYHAAVFEPSLFQFKEHHFFEQDFTNPIVNGTLRFPHMINRKHENYAVISSIVDQIFNKHINSKMMTFASLTLLFCTLMDMQLLEQVSDEFVYKKTEDVKACIKYMEENYARKITLAELAGLVHITPNYFCHYFKKQTGLTPFTQLNNIRIQQASRMLRHTKGTITEIAEACGYENANYFIRKFKEARGCTPSVYRKTLPF